MQMMERVCNARFGEEPQLSGGMGEDSSLVQRRPSHRAPTEQGGAPTKHHPSRRQLRIVVVVPWYRGRCTGRAGPRPRARRRLRTRCSSRLGCASPSPARTRPSPVRSVLALRVWVRPQQPCVRRDEDLRRAGNRPHRQGRGRTASRAGACEPTLPPLGSRSHFPRLLVLRRGKSRARGVRRVTSGIASGSSCASGGSARATVCASLHVWSSSSGRAIASPAARASLAGRCTRAQRTATPATARRRRERRSNKYMRHKNTHKN